MNAPSVQSALDLPPEGAAAVKPLVATSLSTLYCADFLETSDVVADGSVDVIVADPPYGLGKDYGNDSDLRKGDDYVAWSAAWLELALAKLKPHGTLYLFASWQHAPELFSWVKRRMTMVNEIIWDRRVPSMGGSTRRFSSVHDNIGMFVNGGKYYFDLDSVRIPYDAETKKARSRKIFEGKKWLELGYNPKDLWSFPRLHRQDPERSEHPTQKPMALIERMVLASCPPDGLVMDPFIGSGTTAVASQLHARRCVGFEINPMYCDIAQRRLEHLTQHLADVAADDAAQAQAE